MGEMPTVSIYIDEDVAKEAKNRLKCLKTLLRLLKRSNKTLAKAS